MIGRTDNFGHGRPDLDDTIRRLTAFAEVGADVPFAPYLPDVTSVRAVIAAGTPTPVNVVVSPNDKTLTVPELQALGVKRISTGFALYGHVMTELQNAARALCDGDIPTATSGMTLKTVVGLLRQARNT